MDDYDRLRMDADLFPPLYTLWKYLCKRSVFLGQNIAELVLNQSGYDLHQIEPVPN